MTQIPHAALFTLLATMILPSCGQGGSAFRGAFRGSSMGQPVQVDLQPDGNQVTGQVLVGQLPSTFRGTIAGDRLTGTASTPMMGEIRIEAQLTGDTLHWTAHLPNPLQGGTTAVTVDLQRTGAEAGAAQGAAAGAPAAANLDLRLVGNWRRTLNQSVRRASDDHFSMATDIYCTLAADGTCRYGGGVTAFSATNPLGSAGGQSGAAPVTTGRWKTEGQVLWAQATGTTQWVPMGRYSVSGDGLVLYPAGGGEAQYWERT